MQIAHIRLLVSNFADCFRFYRDILQLKPSWGDEHSGYASFDQEPEGKVALALFQRQSMSEVLGTSHLPLDAPAQDRCTLIVDVPDVDAEVHRLKQQGVKFVMDPTDFPGWGYRGAYLRDPDGNLIELFSGLPEDRWSDGLRSANEKWAS